MKKLKVKKAVPVWHVWHVSEPVPSLSIKIRPGQILHPDRREKSVRPMACPQCGKCAEACPEGAITQNPKGVYMINKKKCTGCGKCAEACPFGLIVKQRATRHPNVLPAASVQKHVRWMYWKLLMSNF